MKGLSYRGKLLAYMPFVYEHPTYWKKVENIKEKLILIGADDDSFWEAGKYVRRMDQRLQQHPHECEATRKDVDKRHSAALHEWIAV